MKKEVMLKIEGIKKSFGGILALDGVSLELNEGEIVSIIGPNGAGKTTVFNILTGVYTLDEGRIIFKGGRNTKQGSYTHCKGRNITNFSKYKAF